MGAGVIGARSMSVCQLTCIYDSLHNDVSISIILAVRVGLTFRATRGGWAAARFLHVIIIQLAAGPDGRSLLFAVSKSAGGKSELRRAVCRITSGRAGSSRFDGKCHREHTARAARLR